MKSNKIAITILIAGITIAGLVFSNSRGGNNEKEAQELNPESKITHGHGLAVDIADSNNLYIATHHGLLVLKNEKDLYRVGNSRDDYMGFSVHPTDSKVFLSSGHPATGGNMGFQKSEDGGFTWQKVSLGVNGPVDFHAMAISPVNPELVYGWYQGKLQRSINGGKDWNIINDKVIAMYFAADSQDENTIYAATPNGVLLSKDKGATWQSISKELEGGAVATIAIDPKNSKNMLTFSERIGGLAKSIDNGSTWKKVQETFSNQAVLHIAYDRNNPAIVYTLTSQNEIYKSLNSGDTWTKVY